jgi:hypothetical protein
MMKLREGAPALSNKPSLVSQLHLLAMTPPSTETPGQCKDFAVYFTVWFYFSMSKIYKADVEDFSHVQGLQTKLYS